MKYIFGSILIVFALSGCSSCPFINNVQNESKLDTTNMCLDMNNNPVLAKGQTGLVVDDYFYCNENLLLEKRIPNS